MNGSGKNTAAASAVVLLFAAAAIEAHHSPIMFDTANAVTIRGTIVRFERINPHSFLHVDLESEDGRIERWLVESPSIPGLERRGIGTSTLTAGAGVEACGYLLKDPARSPPGVRGPRATRRGRLDAGRRAAAVV